MSTNNKIRSSFLFLYLTDSVQMITVDFRLIMLKLMKLDELNMAAEERVEYI